MDTIFVEILLAFQKLIFKDRILKAQKRSIPPSRKSSIGSKRSACISKELLTEAGHKKEVKARR